MADPLIIFESAEGTEQSNLADKTTDSGHSYTLINAASGNWSYSSDALRYSTSVSSDKATVLFSTAPSANSRVIMRFQINAHTSTDPTFAVGRRIDANNMYLFGGFANTGDSSGLRIWEIEGGTVTELSANTGDNKGDDHCFVLDCSDSGKSITHYPTSGSPVTVSTTSNDLTSGSYGFAAGNFIVETDDIAVNNTTYDDIMLVEVTDDIQVVDCMLEISTTALESHTPEIGTAWAETIQSSGDSFQVIGISGSISFGEAVAANNATFFMQATPNPSDPEQHGAMGFNTVGTSSNDTFGFVHRYADSNNYYFFGMDEAGNAEIVLMEGGSPTQIASTSMSSTSAGGYMQSDCEDTTKSFVYRDADGNESSISNGDNSITAAGGWGIAGGEITGDSGDDASNHEVDFVVMWAAAEAGGGTVTGTVNVDGAIADTKSAAFVATATIQALQSATVSADGAIAAAVSAFLNANAAVRDTIVATASADAAVQDTMTAATAIDAYLTTAVVANTATTDIDAAIQALQSIAASVDSAIAKAMVATLDIDAGVAKTTTATISGGGAVQATAAAGVPLDAAISIARAVSLFGNGAVAETLTKVLSVGAGIAVTRSVVTDVDGAIAAQKTVSHTIDGAVLESQTATVSVSALLSGAFFPMARRTVEIGGGRTITTGGQGRIIKVSR